MRRILPLLAVLTAALLPGCGDVDAALAAYCTHTGRCDVEAGRACLPRDAVCDPGTCCGRLTCDAVSGHCVDGVRPILAPSVSALAFEQTTVGQSSSLSVEVTNSGQLASDLLTVTVETPPGVFSASGCEGQTLAVGQACTLAVLFQPTRIGPFAGRIQLQDGPGPRAAVAVLDVAGVSGAEVRFRAGGDGPGSIHGADGGISCPGQCAGYYAIGSRLSVVASTDAGTSLASWSGVACTGPACEFEVAGPMEVTANFSAWLQLDVENLDYGQTRIYSDGPPWVGCTGQCGFPITGPVRLIPQAQPGFKFLGWEGDCGSAGLGPCTLDVEGPVRAIARFQPYNVMFLTTNTYPPNSFAADGSGADAICAREAAEFEVPANAYRAWLSTTGRDPAAALGGARGWVRRDGAPLAGTREDLVAGRLLSDPTLVSRHTTYDFERKSWDTPVAAGSGIASGPGQTCADWTSVTGTFIPGQAGFISQGWNASSGVVASCLTPVSLYCFGTRYDTQLTLPQDAGYMVFASSPWTPSGGPGAADTVCQADAVDAGLPGTFRAFLAGPLELPSARVGWPDYLQLPLIGWDRTIISTSQRFWATGANTTARGEVLPTDGGADDPDALWTGGPNAYGSGNGLAEQTCNFWQGDGGMGITIRPDIPASGGEGTKLSACDRPHRFYCAGQAPFP